ncbi:MAG: hypothetical protein LBS74_09005 [Oscillospiraceae bacterium]|jgi:hypothetical protein|nr:hypothetical protein [Oscillospiraceae bacterium]
MKRKIFALLIAVALILSLLASCGQSKDTDSSFLEASSGTDVSAVSAEEKPQYPAEIELSDAEWTELNIFFSNFAEQHFDSYSSKTGDDELAAFALFFNYYNNGTLFTHESGTIKGTDGDFNYNCYVPSKEITSTIQRFFGRSYIPQAFGWRGSGSVNVLLKNEKFYFVIGDGESLTDFAQVTNFADNGDKTFTAEITLYRDNSIGGGNLVNKEVYAPAQNWSQAIKDRCEKSSTTATAIVAKQKYNGKEVYRLLELK